MENDEVELNIMSFNIRYNNPDDGENIWDNRKDMAAEVFKDHDIDVAGLQEVTKEQLDDLNDRLRDYAYIGVGREDGKFGGELSPIYYKEEDFTLLDQGTLWLSETPEIVGSIGWDAALPRIFTWGKFKDNDSGKEFCFINTHFDHRGEMARLQSSHLVMEKAPQLADGDMPLMITGDFNYTEESEGYKVMTDDHEDISLNDAMKISEAPFEGDPITINGFDEENAQDKIIDFIFVRDGIDVLDYDILKIKEGDVYVSDHYPVISRVLF
ncbi:MAG: endonuclease/exonuclease/phosphatase family protein [Marinilabilia sp.]